MLLAACSPSPGAHAPARAAADIVLRPEAPRVVEARVPPHATLASLLRAHDVSEDVVQALVATARRTFDPRHLRASQPYRLEHGVDGLLREFTYQIDTDRFLRIVGLRTTGGAPRFDVQVLPYEKERALVSVSAAISPESPSLVAAMAAAGEGTRLAMQVAEVFKGEIDFENELHAGDRVELLFEKIVRDGEFAGYGDLVAAQVTNEGRTYEAYRYTPKGGKAEYFDRTGRSLNRFFLRTPLKFEPRITSRFSYRRLHPVLGRVRAHRGVDYGASHGTPVLAVASGRVGKAGWMRGGGRTVTLRHENGYETRYLHLSSFASGIRAGRHVEQGQAIGRVGATGLATGPHLHYELLRNGTHLNPLAEHRKFPAGQLLAAGDLASYRTFQARAESRFAGRTAPLVASLHPANPSVF
jgi:murein DD-endopeptidase MepM/ murein hydrolase activator NlpD